MKINRVLNSKTMAAAAILLSALLVAAGVFLLKDRKYMLISMVIVILSFIPFAAMFEGKKPRAREITVTAVMIAIAVVSRAAFFMLPQFKPMTAVVIISGIALGGEAGFVVGAMSAFVSNMLVGQGPWTPWQMFALGIIGFISGLIFTEQNFQKKKLIVGIYGFLAAFLIYGFIVDTSTIVMTVYQLNFQAVLAVYLAGVPFYYL